MLISLDGASSSPQLWGTEPWEPERRAKSLGFLGRDEAAQAAHETIDNNSLAAARDDDSKHDKDDGKDDKKAILNVSDKDSPYALIDKYFPERESYFYQNHNKFQTEYRQLPADKREDIGDLDPGEVSSTFFTIFCLIVQQVIAMISSYQSLIHRKIYRNV